MTLIVWFLSFFLAAAPAAVSAPAVAVPPAPSFVGSWLMEDQDVVIEISRQGNAYVGRYVAFRKSASDPKKKALLNTYLLKDLKPDGDELSGVVLDPKSGKDYKTTLSLTGPKTLEMRVKAMGMTAHKETWTRQAGNN
ncbi:DUF2147 domain-containing protein [Hymenobacter monticola]|uniref:DUF2147 domain-containing protein n=1 Tax=Hymenobacter monticola TaxID=1705399 RepID=A0ABY4BCD0_9BACT|nr:DUF2147 domain-containing protein [Hymenobacter monticola]UOE36434.1 DUF2147 domain-containing protein [Hymenobacter monticola]